jgi:ABC-type Fe3+-siderophore transport system permease subunit
VFILYGVLAGVLVGRLIGGRLERLATVRFRLASLVVLGLVVQIVLFSPLADPLPEAIARIVYVVSTVAVAVAVLANLRLSGTVLIVAGAALNLAAILANGGAMPTSADALAVAGIAIGPHTNSIASSRPVLEPLTDVLALPAWIPLANVFSVGDVLVGVGLAWTIAAGMRRSIGPADAPSA